MQRREAKFQTKFAKWAKYNWDAEKNPAYFEYKTTAKNSISFSAVSEKQDTNLQIKKFYHKFNDLDRLGSPFDAVMFCGIGYVVINYNYPSKDFYIIDIDDWLKEKETSKRKSLTEERANIIGKKHQLGIIE